MQVEKIEISIEALEEIFQKYYPKISHKTAGYIIKDIKNAAEKE
ncbi:hypothetical protein ACVR1I_08660 [Streptococcus cameli]